VQPQAAGVIGVAQRERQRRIARARAQHDIAHATADQLVDDDSRLHSRWVHHWY
jgi:hypothetical protein